MYSKYHTIISISFAILILIILKAQLISYLPDFFSPREKYTGIPGVDNLLNFLLLIFTEALNDPTGLLISHLGIPLCLITFFNVALEASIPDVSGWITHYSLFALAAQLLGFGVAIPLVWIPAWIASKNKRIEEQDPINPDRVKGIFFGLFIFVFISMIAMSFFTNPTMQAWSIIFFQVSPFLAALFWVKKPRAFIDNSGNSCVSDDGYKQATIYYLIIFGLSIYSWVFFWIHAIDNSLLYLWTPFAQLFNDELVNATIYFAINIFGLIMSSIYWVFLVEGASFTPRFQKFLWQNVLLSPAGALALYGYDRYLAKTRSVRATSGSRYGTEPSERAPLFSQEHS